MSPISSPVHRQSPTRSDRSPVPTAPGTTGGGPPAGAGAGGASRAPGPVTVLIGAVAAGLVVGPLDLLGQTGAPYPFANLFNSPGVWAAIAFALGWWSGRPVTGAPGAAVLMVVAVEAYYVASVVVGRSDAAVITPAAASAWVVAGVAAGCLFGAAGAVARGSRPRPGRLVAGGLLPAVFLTEAGADLVRIATEPADGRPDDLGSTALLLTGIGLVSLAAIGVGSRSVERHLPGLALSTAILAAAGTAAYAVLVHR